MTDMVTETSLRQAREATVTRDYDHDRGFFIVRFTNGVWPFHSTGSP